MPGRRRIDRRQMERRTDRRQMDCRRADWREIKMGGYGNPGRSKVTAPRVGMEVWR